MKKFVLFFSFLGFGIFSNAQSSLSKTVADSLWSIWIDNTAPDSLRMDALHEIAWTGFLYSNPDSSCFYAEMLESFAKSKNYQLEAALAIYLQGITFFYRGNYDEAIVRFERSLKIQESISNEDGISTALNALGIIYSEKGEFEKAMISYRKSLELALKTGDSRSIAVAMSNLGSILQNLGNYIQAVEYYQKSALLFEQTMDQRGYANVMSNMGSICMNQGDYERALLYYQECLKIKTSLGEKKGIATCKGNIGLVFQGTGQYEEAITNFNQSKLIQEEIGDSMALAFTLQNLALSYAHTGNFELALDYLYRSIQIASNAGDKDALALNYNNLSQVYRNKKEHNLALHFSALAYQLAKELNYYDLLEEASQSVYLDYMHLNKMDSAYYFLTEHIKQSNRMMEINYYSLSEIEKISFFHNREISYGLFYDFVIFNKGENIRLLDSAYNIVLQSKGLTLKSSSAMRTAVSSSGDSLLIRDYEVWLKMKSEIAEQYAKGNSTQDLEDRASILEKELIKRSGTVSGIEKIQNLDWQQVRDGLTEGEAAIEFVHFKSEIDTANPVVYAAFVVRPESEHPDVVRLCTEDELKEIIGLIQGNNLSFVERVYGKRSEGKKDLYQKIWQPLEPYLQNVKTVYYSPSGLLHKVSFAAICKDQDVYLSDVYNFRQMGSTGNLAFDKNMNFGELENFLLMGGVNYQSENESENEVWTYLPGSLTETDAIHTYLVKKKFGVNYFTGLNASEEIFKEKISSSSIVHIATHGFFFPDPEQIRAENQRESVKENQGEELKFRGSTNYANWSFVNNKNPLMRSGIVLAKANEVWQRDPLAEGEDGILTAQEVSNLDLRNTKLVVLSACETGLGDIKGSEGVFGLQRAFKMAGVKYLIMSLWQVPDKETSEFMILFYKNLIKLKDIPTAFQKTQKEMREKYDPYYWGAFVLIE